MVARLDAEDIRGSSYSSQDPFDRKRGVKKTTISVPPSDWVSRFVRIKDGDKGVAMNISFDEREYLKRVYDTPSKNVLLFTSRQTEKSTTIANKQLAASCMNAMYTSLFITPSAMQTTVYSKTRIDDIIELSPLIASMTHQALTMNILEKEFANRAKIYLRYAFLNADRVRGLSVNAIYADEIQDLLVDVMPIIEETASHFERPVKVYSGTPKTFDNNIEHYWSKASTMNEWAIPCEHHGASPSTWHWNILGVKNIGKSGPICSKCGNPLYPEHPHAQWVRMRKEAEFEGFRICRLMVPWFRKQQEKWNEILQAYERYPTAQFMNEVMAISHDTGSKPITREEIIQACDSTYRIDEDQVAELGRSIQLYAGIDHGAGTENSQTVFSVGGYVRPDEKFQFLYHKRMDGPLVEPGPQIEEFCRLIEKFNIKYVGADYGMGFYPNKILTAKYGPQRIHQFQYGFTLTQKVIFKPKLLRYLVYRTPVMSDIFNAIKSQKIMLPAWEDFQTPFADDVLSIFSDYSEARRMTRFDKPRGATDDTFHSMVFCFLASMFDHRRPDIMSSLKEGAHDPMAALEEAEVAWMEEADLDQIAREEMMRGRI